MSLKVFTRPNGFLTTFIVQKYDVQHKKRILSGIAVAMFVISQASSQRTRQMSFRPTLIYKNEEERHHTASKPSFLTNPKIN